MSNLKNSKIIPRAVCLIVALINIAVFVLMTVNLHRLYTYFTVLSPFRMIFFSLMILLPFIVGITMAVIYLRIEKRGRIWGFASLFVSVIFSFIFMMSMSLVSPFGSQTDNSEDYLKFDEACAISTTAFSKLFPEEIPKNAENTKYFYRYHTYPDELYDVVAEWTLPREEYEREKNRVLSEYSSIMHNTYGEYKCVYISSEKKTDYDYIFFAYNDENRTLRYIVSYIDNVDINGLSPYYETLDW